MFTIFTKSNYIQIQTESTSIYWGNSANNPKINNSIFLSQDRSNFSFWDPDKGVISNIGQFSLKSFEIDSFLLNDNDLCYKVKFDHINFAFLSNIKESSVIEKIGEPQILFIQTNNSDIPNILSVCQNANPKLVVFFSQNQDIEKIKQLITQNLTSMENGYKIRSKDLNTENTQYLIISNN